MKGFRGAIVTRCQWRRWHQNRDKCGTELDWRLIGRSHLNTLKRRFVFEASLA